jgi:hypothetical protein
MAVGKRHDCQDPAIGSYRYFQTNSHQNLDRQDLQKEACSERRRADVGAIKGPRYIVSNYEQLSTGCWWSSYHRLMRYTSLVIALPSGILQLFVSRQ